MQLLNFRFGTYSYYCLYIFLAWNIQVQVSHAQTLERQNTFLGQQSGSVNTEGNWNTFFGSYAGLSNTTANGNTFIGSNAGYANTDGEQNVFCGYNSGVSSISAYSNVFVGGYSGAENTTGNQNVFLGDQAGRSNTTGSENVFIGQATGLSNTSGSQNTFLGLYSGAGCQTGSGNIFIGYNAGAYDASSNKLYIENSISDMPLIYGDFDTDQLVINGNANHTPTGRTLFVNGSIGASSAFNNDSDRRLKTNIKTIPGALDKIQKIRGVSFDWKDGREKGPRIGFIAQEVEAIFPQVVDHENDHYTMQYAPMAAVLVEAIKEQQQEIEELKAQNQRLEQQISRIDQLEAMLQQLQNQDTYEVSGSTQNK